MGRFGFLLVVGGVAALLADELVEIDAETADVVTGGAWVAIAIGAVLLLHTMADAEGGPGVFVLAAGVAALAAHPSTEWLAADALEGWRFWIELGIALLIGGGVLGIVVSLSGLDDESALGALLLFALASLVADIVVDFGPGWDDLANVGTVLLAAGFGSAAVLAGTEEIEMVDAGPSRVYSAHEHGWGNVAVQYCLQWGARLAVLGLGLAAVLVTIAVSFDLPALVDILLSVLAILGVYTVAPTVAYASVIRAVTPERMERAGVDGIAEAFEDRKLLLDLAAALGAGYVALTLLVVGVLFGPAAWLAALLVLAAVGAGVVAVRYGLGAFPLLTQRLVAVSEEPERNAPTIAELLGELLDRDPVFRLLPHG